MALRRTLLAALGLAAALPASAAASREIAAPQEIVVSANDGKPVRPGDTAAMRVPDTLAVLDAGGGRLRLLGTVEVPTSMTGPPESVKITPDGRFAIVTSAQAVNPAGSPLMVPGDALSVVDLRVPGRPRVVQSLHAGAGAAGVAINRAGTVVAVANGGADSVSAYRLTGGQLTLVASLALPGGSKPVSVRFTPDGRQLLVVAQNAGQLFRAEVDAAALRLLGQPLDVGGSPFGMSLARDGSTAYVANLDGSGRPGAVSIVDVAAFRVLAQVPVGAGPENVALSPSGRYLQVTLVNGTQLPVQDPLRREEGLLKVYATGGGTLTPVAQVATGKLCQGAAWSRDERHLYLQCAETRTIERYRFDGRHLQRDGAALPMAGRPGAMAVRQGL